MSLFQIFYILWRRWRIVASIFAGCVAAALLFLLIAPSRYDATASASIDPGQPDPINNTTPGAGGGLMIFQGNMVALAKSNRVALAVVKELGLDADPDVVSQYASSRASGVIGVDQWIANDLLEHVDAKFSEKGPQSNVLSIIYKSKSAEKSAQIANAFLKEFMASAVEMKQDFAKTGAQWFVPQIEQARSELEAAQKRLTDFQSVKSVVVASTGDSENEQLLSVTAELSKTKTELIALESQLKGSPEAATQSNEAQTIDQTTLTSLRGSLSGVNSEIARLQKEVGANNPKLSERLALRKSLLSQIDGLIADDRKRLKDRIAERKLKIEQFEAARAAAVKAMIEVQAKRNELNSLTHEVEFRQSELERLQKSASQARLQSQLSFTNIVVLDEATPPAAAASPKKPLILAGGLGGGLALGLIAALLWEMLDRRIRFEGDLGHLFEAPVLGRMRSSRPGSENPRISELKNRLINYRPNLPRLRREASSS